MNTWCAARESGDETARKRGKRRMAERREDRGKGDGGKRSGGGGEGPGKSKEQVGLGGASAATAWRVKDLKMRRC